MSLYGALNIGVAGLTAASQALSVTSSNIANVNTVGYKEATASFSTYLDSSLGTAAAASAGVTTVTGQNVSQAGLATTTSSSTDLSIAGNGFFAVDSSNSPSATQEYTQVGSFSPDANGDLVNTNGQYLLGWKLDSAGNMPTNTSTLGLVNVSSLSGAAAATTTASLQTNLGSTSTVDSTYTAGDMTSGVVSPDYETTINAYDSQGGIQPISMSFIKTGANTWAYEAAYTGSSSNLSSANPIATGTLSFNSDGSLANVNGASPASGTFAMTIPWSASSGLSSQTVNVSLGTVGETNGVTQFNTASGGNQPTVDGSPYGTVTGVTVGTDGTVTAQFSNGLSQNVYKIPVVTFNNPDGLTPLSGNAYAVSNESGAANVNAAGSGGAGTIKSDSLEGSTVDLSTEFTNLITAQNAYSAAARVVTTADQMLQTLEQIPST
jgi:flagellar hook protein FlgE